MEQRPHHTQGRLSLRTLLESLLLLGFAAGFLSVYLTGSVRNYLNPRLDPFVLFAGIAFLLMAVLLSLHLFTRQHGKLRLWTLSLFLIPVPLLLLRTGSAAAPGASSLSGTQIVGLPTPNRIKNDWGSFTLAEGPIAITDKNYMAAYDELGSHPEKYAGRTLMCTGYVVRSGVGLPKDEFVAARDLMWCCAADLMTVGFQCRYTDAAKLPEKSWVRVTGTLAVTEYGGKSAPILINVTVTPIAKPDPVYIYPFQ